MNSSSLREVTTEPKTRYTRRLMLAAPVPDPVRPAERRARLRVIEAA